MHRCTHCIEIWSFDFHLQLDKAMAWQLAYPSGTAEECIEWLREANSKRIKLQWLQWGWLPWLIVYSFLTLLWIETTCPGWRKLSQLAAWGRWYWEYISILCLRLPCHSQPNKASCSSFSLLGCKFEPWKVFFLCVCNCERRKDDNRYHSLPSFCLMIFISVWLWKKKKWE